MQSPALQLYCITNINTTYCAHQRISSNNTPHTNLYHAPITHTIPTNIHASKPRHCTWWMHTHTRTHARTHKQMHAHTHTYSCKTTGHYKLTDTYKYVRTSTQHLPPNMFFISLPKSLILGLPCSSIIILQTNLKASSLHFRRRHSCKIWFCSVVTRYLMMVIKSKSLIMLLCTSSCTMALASTVAMNLARKWPRTSSAAQTGKSCITHTSQQQLVSSYPTRTLRPLSVG